ncbi:hypothetical protein Poly51_11120 [Rubripirellula tenax]|uniref:Lipoprotein n=1 Tax=Rubripirellula tenax TaxID=2528015 RepID=A0A5C6FH37_9BACT|nr:hypothetical protein [Rubripirellula tenax]TWU60831.1 hypothetical protein Poly51_11120 [Rubripirellula tenax]
MNSRIATMMTAVTLIVISTGCGATRNFLFGRGAQCGLCTKLGSCLPKPQFGNMMPAPCASGLCGSAPVAAPAYAPAFQAPQGVATAPSCGCQSYAGTSYPSDAYSSGTCGCGNAYDSYAPAVSDPYLSSGSVYDGGSIPYEGQVIGEPAYPPSSIPMESYPSGAYPSAPVTSEGWQARKIDTDGNKILWEEPLPSGAKAL